MNRFCVVGLLAVVSLFASFGVGAQAPPESNRNNSLPPALREKPGTSDGSLALPPQSVAFPVTAKPANLQDQGFDQLIGQLTDVRAKKAELDKREKDLIAALQAKQKQLRQQLEKLGVIDGRAEPPQAVTIPPPPAVDIPTKSEGGRR